MENRENYTIKHFSHFPVMTFFISSFCCFASSSSLIPELVLDDLLCCSVHYPGYSVDALLASSGKMIWSFWELSELCVILQYNENLMHSK